MARISGMRRKIISSTSGGRAALYHQAEATKKASGAKLRRSVGGPKPDALETFGRSLAFGGPTVAAVLGLLLLL